MAMKKSNICHPSSDMFLNIHTLRERVQFCSLRWVILGGEIFEPSFAAGEKWKKGLKWSPKNSHSLHCVCHPYKGFFCINIFLRPSFWHENMEQKYTRWDVHCMFFSRLSKFSFACKKVSFFPTYQKNRFTVVWEGEKSWGSSPVTHSVTLVRCCSICDTRRIVDKGTGADFDILFRFEGEKKYWERDFFLKPSKSMMGREKNLHSHDESKE